MAAGDPAADVVTLVVCLGSDSYAGSLAGKSSKHFDQRIRLP